MKRADILLWSGWIAAALIWGWAAVI